MAQHNSYFLAVIINKHVVAQYAHFFSRLYNSLHETCFHINKKNVKSNKERINASISTNMEYWTIFNKTEKKKRFIM